MCVEGAPLLIVLFENRWGVPVGGKTFSSSTDSGPVSGSPSLSGLVSHVNVRYYYYEPLLTWSKNRPSFKDVQLH